MRCDTCKKWTWLKESNQYLPEDSVGICDGLPGEGMDIEISAGWDGGIVERIETKCSFFCAYYDHDKSK